MNHPHHFERPKSRRAHVIAALIGLSLLATAGAADAHPRHKHRHNKHCHHPVVVRERVVVAGPYRPVYATPYVDPCGYREVWRPGYWQWHEASHCNVWVPGATIVVRF